MKKWYAVRRGLMLGVFNDWYDVQQSISGIESPEFKSFPTKKLAECWYNNKTPVECDFKITRKTKPQSNEKIFQLSFVVLDWKSKFETTDQTKLINKMKSVLKQSSATNFTLNDIHIYSKLKTMPEFSHYFHNNKVKYTGKIYTNGVTLPNSYKINREPVVIDKSL